MRNRPLVTVICLCYNHEMFVAEAIRSVINQTYEKIEIIIADDASNDGSVDIIKKIIRDQPGIKSLFLEDNLGNCKAFNRALKLATGEFIVDFATDDVMLPERIQKQIEHFNTLDESYGVVFSNADYIDKNGQFLRNHFEHLRRHGLIREIPEGDVYQQVLSRYFIPSPTMISRRVVFERLDGYDERLSYEDFDFWIRSSRDFRYSFLDEVTTRIRISPTSMSRGWYVKGDKQLHSTYLVCKKAVALNRNESEVKSLAIRLRYELRQSVFSENHHEAALFFELLNEINQVHVTDRLLIQINKFRIPLGLLRRTYQRLRFGI